MTDWADDKAAEMFPCNCELPLHRDGSPKHHFHDCQSQYADDVAEVLRSERVRAETAEAQAEACREALAKAKELLAGWKELEDDEYIRIDTSSLGYPEEEYSALLHDSDLFQAVADSALSPDAGAALLEQMKQLEAQAAEMRAVLQDSMQWISHWESETGIQDLGELVEDIERAISTDAGAKLLAVVEAAKLLNYHIQQRCAGDYSISTEDQLERQLRDAISKLKEGE